MTSEMIDHATLTKLADAGIVRSARIVGQPGGWGILVKDGTIERVLAAQRSQQVRIFRKFETLVAYLRGIGIMRFDVDAMNWAPNSLIMGTRPDTTVSLEQAQAAAAYDKWLKAEVQESIDDTHPSIPNEKVKLHFAAKREALR